MIVSTTITASSERDIRGALESVLPEVDLCLVVDTGATDGTISVAREVAGDRLRVASFPWVNDFSAARNFALEEATRLGAGYALSVDSDERINWNGDSPRDQTAPVVLFRTLDGSHVKEHLIRLPAEGRYDGPIHEAYPSIGGVVLPRARTWELPKNPEQRQAKFQRDLEILVPYSEARPEDPRWLYYIGQTHACLGDHGRAILAFRACAALHGWREEGAWACYLMAVSLQELERWRESVEACAQGLSRHAGVAELCWLAGYGCHRMGEQEQAIYWARMAIAGGLYYRIGQEDSELSPRIGFRHPPGLWEGPFNVLEWAWRRLGNESRAQHAHLEWENAQRHRLAAALDG